MPTCFDCTYLDDYLDPGKCYADLDYHGPDDTCPFWCATLRKEPVEHPPLVTLWDEGINKAPEGKEK